MSYKDKKDQAAASKRHYEANKEKINNRARAKNAEVLIRNRIFIIEYLKNNPCSVCGEDDPVVLEFDHLDQTTKLYNISTAMTLSLSLKTLMKEIEKCDLKCANCHRRKTAHQFGYYKTK